MKIPNILKEVSFCKISEQKCFHFDSAVWNTFLEYHDLDKKLISCKDEKKTDSLLSF